MEEISFDEWKKLDLKVGKILEVERVPNTDKLYKLQVDIGEEKPIQIVTGLVPYYKEEELKDKKIIHLLLFYQYSKTRCKVYERRISFSCFQEIQFW